MCLKKQESEAKSIDQNKFPGKYPKKMSAEELPTENAQ